MAAGKTYYEMLGVPRNATPKQIKIAYHNIARTYHPDAGSSNVIPEIQDDDVTRTRVFKTASLAYEILSDEKLRQEYDRTLPPEPGSLQNKRIAPTRSVFGRPETFPTQEEDKEGDNLGIFSRACALIKSKLIGKQ